MQYVYEGPGPQEDSEGGIVRPGDVRGFDADPGPPWRAIVPEAAEKPAAPPPTPSPPPPAGGQPAASPAAPTPKDGM